ncbi:MAG: hypothetical protein IJ429_03375 [Lachnospiraceae bacterium]|nr:hypothetical protein [Lachnospiraceae bacterium]
MVDNYGLPSEYMYNAGGIWEERIHPDDRENYHNRVEEVFNGVKAEELLCRDLLKVVKETELMTEENKNKLIFYVLGYILCIY